MNTGDISNVYVNNYQLEKMEEKDLIEKEDFTISLPNEIFQHIFSYLKNKDFSSTSLVNHLFKQQTISFTQHNEVIYTNNFVQSLIDNLSLFMDDKDEKLYSNQKKQLESLISPDSGNSLRDCLTFNESRLFTIKFQNELAEILKDLQNQDLSSLEKLAINEKKSKSTKNIFPLARIYADIEAWKIKDSNFPSSDTLKGIVHKLARFGDFDKALEVAEKIEDKEKGYALYVVSHELKMIGNFDEALKVAEKIEDKWRKGWVLNEIYNELAMIGEFEKALEVVEKLKNKKKGHALYQVSKKLAEIGNFDKALEVAEKIGNPYLKAYTLNEIVEELTKFGNFDKALEVAEKIENEDEKTSALLKVSNKLAKIGEFDKALEVAEKIEDKYRKESNALNGIVEELAKIGEFDKALEVAEKIGNPYLKAYTLNKIVEELTKIEYLDKALEVAGKIDDKEIHDCALENIGLAKDGWGNDGWVGEL